MDPFTADYLANLTADLTTGLLQFAGRRTRQALTGSEAEAALRRAVESGVVALVAVATAADADERSLLDDIFTAFFAEPDVARELALLLRGSPPDLEELGACFADAGYDAEALPGLDFDRAIHVFEAAFLAAATEEPALEGRIEAANALEQTRLQHELVQRMREMVTLLRQAQPGSVGIRAGTIQAHNVVNGQLIIYDVASLSDSQDQGLPWQRDYLNHLFETAGQISLAGIDRKTASDADATLDLSAVYTALLTLTPEECTALSREGCLPEQMGRGERRLSALAQLDRESRLVLLGDPGSGKSTFVAFVALCLAGERLGRPEANLARMREPLPQDEDARRASLLSDEEPKAPEPQPWRHEALLPVRVVLRDFAARGLPPVGHSADADTLWAFIVAELGEALAEFAPHLKRHLHEQGGLLLLDGLDEVPEAARRREQIKQAVEDFAIKFPGCRILVTSRTYAYQQQAWRLDGFAEAVLAPFGHGQIERFVERWYAHIATVRHLNAEDAQGRAALLKRAISASANLQGLAARPLLLTLMASLHAWRGGSLPDKRQELYEDTVDLLLDWWEGQRLVRNNRGEVVTTLPSLAEWLNVKRETMGRDKVRALLDELAYDVHAAQPDEGEDGPNGTADIAEDDLVSRLLVLIEDPDVKPRRLVEYLSQRAGLLVPRGVGVYTFPHRTFQEYLAACHLTDDTFPEKVAALAKDDSNRWREVALLAGAKSAGGSDFALWALVEELCRDAIAPGEIQAGPDAWGALLAGQMLVENVDPAQVSERDQDKMARVVGHLVQILAQGRLPAVERAAAGVVLAKLGDPRPGVGVDNDGLPDIVWCEVPAGPFLMGTRAEKIPALMERYGGERDWYEDETPQHRRTLPSYRISRYPVTNAQFAVFVVAGGYGEGAWWEEAIAAEVWREGRVKGRYDSDWRTAPRDYGDPFNLANHPVVGVMWYEAVAYCRWLSAQLGSRVRLPSEVQWEKAARLEDGSEYPWGDEPDPNWANYGLTGIGATSAVGSFPDGVSRYGVEDMSGNVWEWTRTGWQGNYEGYDPLLSGK